MLALVSVARRSLEQLRDKYGEMLSMRLAHDSGDEDEAEARDRMAELASRFPGALREIDDLELDAIRTRIRKLDQVLRDGDEIEPWMEAVALFHQLARGALWAKRWLAGRKVVDSSTAREYESDAVRAVVAADALAWTNHLAAVAAPPRGRVMDLVFARVARTLGTSEKEARSLIFGTSRRRRLG